MIHLVGIAITVEGRYVRQHCSWCGTRLVDVDLAKIGVPEGQGTPSEKGWECGRWLRVEGTWPTAYSYVDEPMEDKMPPGACMEDVSPAVRLVEPLPDPESPS